MSVPIGIQKRVLVRSRGFCEKKGEDFTFVEPEIHHRDRDRENNHLDNLLVLCPSCHSMMHWNLDGTLKKKDFDLMQEFPYYQY